MKHNIKWVIALLVLAAALGGLALYLKNKDSGHIANIYQDGTCIRTIDLDAVEEPYSFTVTDEDGHENTVSVEKGRICVSEANCPDQVCVNSGWLSTGVEPIVCLPAKLVIRLEETAESSELEIDGVAG